MNSIIKDMNHLMTFSGQDLTGLTSHFSAQHTFMVTWQDLTMSYSLQLQPCFGPLLRQDLTVVQGFIHTFCMRRIR